MNRDVFETVCAFPNRNGGHLFLGVDDQGGVVGIDSDSIEKVKMDFVTAMNNPLKISPTFYLSIEAVEIENRTILHILVP
ncbi:helix-turn-helix domain-containing protein [Acetobacterium paludosum]|uniref:AlbA family DNA-binding domain-containing protein n=1 Tax=Acetobacterium paludosum TaxID=52693 RepID=UPI001FA95904|nr:ATP-binding protein [Acetobacterium paludosum]